MEQHFSHVGERGPAIVGQAEEFGTEKGQYKGGVELSKENQSGFHNVGDWSIYSLSLPEAR